MTTRRSLAVAPLLFALTLAAGCRRGAEPPAGETAADEGPPLVSQAVDDLPEVSYDPPADGRLTEAQIEMYLEVKRAAGERDGDPGAAGLRAAHGLGHNHKEYAWVEARIADAQIARSGLGLEEEMAEGRNEYLEVLRGRLAAASSATERADVESRIAELEKGGETSPPEISDAERHNVELVAKYEERLAEVQSAEERFAAGSGPEEAPLEPPVEEDANAAGGQEPEG